jgi:hypothetical protein
VSGLRYQIDIAGFVSYPDLNISQIFDPPIYGYIVKITQVLTKTNPIGYSQYTPIATNPEKWNQQNKFPHQPELRISQVLGC